MTSNIGDYRSSALFPAQNAAADRRQSQVSRLFGSRDDDTRVSGGAVYGQGNKSFSRFYTEKGTYIGTQLKEKLASFDKRTPVQKVLDKVSKEAYTDWKDTAMHHKMSLVSQLFVREDTEEESREEALYNKERNEVSKPYPARDMLMGDKVEKQPEPQAAKFAARNTSAKNDAGLFDQSSAGRFADLSGMGLYF